MTEPAADTLDLPYPSGFYSFQTPTVMTYAAALNGVAAPSPDRSFTYADFGCGDGFTLITLATLYPRSRFIGIDLNPEHIARGRGFVAAAGIDNVRLIEGGFEDWRDFDLPPLDYVAMHGVYAWISEPARAALLAAIGDRLAPAGLVYLGYNAQPGWAVAAPLRQFFQEWSRALGGDTLDTVRQTATLLRELARRKADFFAQNPAAAAILEEMLQHDIRYVAHEIHAPHWSPLPFGTVARQMAGIGLAYAGSADLPRNLLRASVRPEFRPLFAGVTDPVRVELLRDTIANTFFRRDVFARSGLARGHADQTITATLFGARTPLEEMAPTVPVLAEAVRLTVEPYRTIREALDRGAMTGSELARLPGLQLLRLGELAQALATLTLGYQISPFLERTVRAPRPAERWRLASAFNRHLLEAPPTRDRFALQASSATGSILAVPFEDAIVLQAVAEAGRDGAADWAWASSHRDWMVTRGKPIPQREAHAAAVAEHLGTLARGRLTKYEELGIIRRVE